MNLDTLFGVVNKTKGKQVILMPQPSKERTCDVVVDVSSVKKQSKLGVVKVVNEDAKKQREEEKKKRQREVEEEKQRESRKALDKEVEGTSQFLEHLEEEQERLRQEKRAKKLEWEKNHLTSSDGTEKPETFDPTSLSHEQGADDARADKIDRLIPVTEYYLQGKKVFFPFVSCFNAAR